MGKQNDAFTAYLGRAEVLADLYNGCLYQGEKVVQAGNLCEVQQFYQQGLSERVKRPTARRRERDAIRAFWNEKSYVLLAAEAQNQPHLTMPFRCIRLKREGKLKTGVEYLNRISRMDVATYDMICVMLNLKELQDKKEKYLKNGKGSIDMCKAMEEWAEELREEGKSAGIKEGMKEGEPRGMQKAKESMLKLVAKMSENGDTDYIARLMEPEVYRRMMDKYGME